MRMHALGDRRRSVGVHRASPAIDASPCTAHAPRGQAGWLDGWRARVCACAEDGWEREGPSSIHPSSSERPRPALAHPHPSALASPHAPPSAPQPSPSLHPALHSSSPLAAPFLPRPQARCTSPARRVFEVKSVWPRSNVRANPKSRALSLAEITARSCCWCEWKREDLLVSRRSR